MESYLRDHQFTCVPVLVNGGPKYLRIVARARRKTIEEKTITEAINLLSLDFINQVACTLADVLKRNPSILEVLVESILEATNQVCKYKKSVLCLSDSKERTKSSLPKGKKPVKKRKSDKTQDEESIQERAPVIPRDVQRSTAEYNSINDRLVGINSKYRKVNMELTAMTRDYAQPAVMIGGGGDDEENDSNSSKKSCKQESFMMLDLRKKSDNDISLIEDDRASNEGQGQQGKSKSSTNLYLKMNKHAEFLETRRVISNFLSRISPDKKTTKIIITNYKKSDLSEGQPRESIKENYFLKERELGSLASFPVKRYKPIVQEESKKIFTECNIDLDVPYDERSLINQSLIDTNVLNSLVERVVSSIKLYRKENSKKVPVINLYKRSATRKRKSNAIEQQSNLSDDEENDADYEDYEDAEEENSDSDE